MAILPVKIPIQPEAAIASYAYTDISEGTGVTVFYGSSTTDNAAVSYNLSSNIQYSDTVVTEGIGTAGNEKILDLDFDLSAFNLPRSIKGTFRAIIPVIGGNETSADKGGTMYAVVKVRKWDGSTETEIASNTKSRISATIGSLDTSQDVFNVEIALASVTNFKKGETLRITVEIWASGQGAAGLQVGLFHDPKDRSTFTYTGGSDAGEFISSTLEFHVPFIIDL